jgi:CubicO group peptidase (beta-lactamase class C family)
MKKTTLLLTACLALFCVANGQKTMSETIEFDKVVKELLPINETGATILVSRRGEIIYKKAVGKANLELNVPMQADHVFKIASLTKQFTAVAILQLFEKGKLGLQDEITKFIPDYPTQGARITIEHLLTHTSGIYDYTNIKDSVQRMKLDVTPLQMINYFKDQPMRFPPGSKYEYSNSNYFLLGYIIEKITGKTYGQYLQDHLFQPSGMINSRYANDSKAIKNRASGYTADGNVIENAAAMSMTQPYAAGAILSTVEDLFKWNQALQSNKLLKKETLQKALARYTLSNGKESNYGYGFRLGYIQESPSVWHGGLINGFMSMAMYLPKEDVFVAVLSNCDCVSPERATAKLAALAIGKPFQSTEKALTDSILQKYTGVYENGSGDRLTFTVAEGRLHSQRGRGPSVPIKAFEESKFFIDELLMTMEFSGPERGVFNELAIKSRTGTERWRKSDQPAPRPAEVKIDETMLESYTGEYEINPQFAFTVTKENGRLYLQAPGQEKLEMFADAPTKFYLKVNDARFEFVSESGKVTKVLLWQGGRATDAKKTR